MILHALADSFWVKNWLDDLEIVLRVFAHFAGAFSPDFQGCFLLICWNLIGFIPDAN